MAAEVYHVQDRYTTITISIFLHGPFQTKQFNFYNKLM